MVFCLTNRRIGLGNPGDNHVFLFEIGSLFTTRTYSLNTLSVACFTLLVINPNSLYDVGFQLSFLAVSGIILLQRNIEKLWIIENRIGHYLWSLISVSLAAQLFTFPLTIYYFHQFPIYFWLSGVVVVPLAFAFLWFGFMFILLGWIPVVGMVVGKLAYGVAWLMNSAIYLIQKIPFIKIEGIWLDDFYLVLCFVLVASISIYIKQGRSYIYYPLIILMVLVSYHNMSTFVQLKSPRFICYYIRGHFVADFMIGKKYYSLGNLPVNSSEYKYNINNNRHKLKLNGAPSALNQFPLYYKEGFIKFGDLTLYHHKEGQIFEDMPEVALFWLSKSLSSADLRLLNKWENVIILIDGAVPYTTAARLESKLVKMGKKTVNMHQTGAYVYKL